MSKTSARTGTVKTPDIKAGKGTSVEVDPIKVDGLKSGDKTNPSSPTAVTPETTPVSSTEVGSHSVITKASAAETTRFAKKAAEAEPEYAPSETGANQASATGSSSVQAIYSAQGPASAVGTEEPAESSADDSETASQDRQINGKQQNPRYVPKPLNDDDAIKYEAPRGQKEEDRQKDEAEAEEKVSRIKSREEGRGLAEKGGTPELQENPLSGTTDDDFLSKSGTSLYAKMTASDRVLLDEVSLCLADLMQTDVDTEDYIVNILSSNGYNKKEIKDNLYPLERREVFLISVFSRSSHHIFAELVKDPTADKQSVQIRRVVLHTGTSQHLVLNPLAAKSLTADFDGDNAAVRPLGTGARFVAQKTGDGAIKYETALEYFFGAINGGSSIDWSFWPKVYALPIDVDTQKLVKMCASQIISDLAARENQNLHVDKSKTKAMCEKALDSIMQQNWTSLEDCIRDFAGLSVGNNGNLSYVNGANSIVAVTIDVLLDASRRLLSVGIAQNGVVDLNVNSEAVEATSNNKKYSGLLRKARETTPGNIARDIVGRAKSSQYSGFREESAEGKPRNVYDEIPEGLEGTPGFAQLDVTESEYMAGLMDARHDDSLKSIFWKDVAPKAQGVWLDERGQSSNIEFAVFRFADEFDRLADEYAAIAASLGIESNLEKIGNKQKWDSKNTHYPDKAFTKPFKKIFAEYKLTDLFTEEELNDWRNKILQNEAVYLPISFPNCTVADFTVFTRNVSLMSYPGDGPTFTAGKILTALAYSRESQKLDAVKAIIKNVDFIANSGMSHLLIRYKLDKAKKEEGINIHDPFWRSIVGIVGELVDLDIAETGWVSFNNVTQSRAFYSFVQLLEKYFPKADRMSGTRKTSKKKVYAESYKSLDNRLAADLMNMQVSFTIANKLDQFLNGDAKQREEIQMLAERYPIYKVLVLDLEGKINFNEYLSAKNREPKYDTNGNAIVDKNGQQQYGPEEFYKYLPGLPKSSSRGNGKINKARESYVEKRDATLATFLCDSDIDIEEKARVCIGFANYVGHKYGIGDALVNVSDELVSDYFIADVYAKTLMKNEAAELFSDDRYDSRFKRLQGYVYSGLVEDSDSRFVKEIGDLYTTAEGQLVGDEANAEKVESIRSYLTDVANGKRNLAYISKDTLSDILMQSAAGSSENTEKLKITKAIEVFFSAFVSNFSLPSTNDYNAVTDGVLSKMSLREVCANPQVIVKALLNKDYAVEIYNGSQRAVLSYEALCKAADVESSTDEWNESNVLNVLTSFPSLAKALVPAEFYLTNKNKVSKTIDGDIIKQMVALDNEALEDRVYNLLCLKPGFLSAVTMYANHDTDEETERQNIKDAVDYLIAELCDAAEAARKIPKENRSMYFESFEQGLSYDFRETYDTIDDVTDNIAAQLREYVEMISEIDGLERNNERGRRTAGQDGKNENAIKNRILAMRLIVHMKSARASSLISLNSAGYYAYSPAFFAAYTAEADCGADGERCTSTITCIKHQHKMRNGQKVPGLIGVLSFMRTNGTEAKAAQDKKQIDLSGGLDTIGDGDAGLYLDLEGKARQQFQLLYERYEREYRNGNTEAKDLLVSGYGDLIYDRLSKFKYGKINKEHCYDMARELTVPQLDENGAPVMIDGVPSLHVFTLGEYCSALESLAKLPFDCSDYKMDDVAARYIEALEELQYFDQRIAAATPLPISRIIDGAWYPSAKESSAARYHRYGTRLEERAGKLRELATTFSRYADISIPETETVYTADSIASNNLVYPIGPNGVFVVRAGSQADARCSKDAFALAEMNGNKFRIPYDQTGTNIRRFDERYLRFWHKVTITIKEQVGPTLAERKIDFWEIDFFGMMMSGFYNYGKFTDGKRSLGVMRVDDNSIFSSIHDWLGYFVLGDSQALVTGAGVAQVGNWTIRNHKEISLTRIFGSDVYGQIDESKTELLTNEEVSKLPIDRVRRVNVSRIKRKIENSLATELRGDELNSRSVVKWVKITMYDGTSYVAPIVPQDLAGIKISNDARMSIDISNNELRIGWQIDGSLETVAAKMKQNPVGAADKYMITPGAAVDLTLLDGRKVSFIVNDETAGKRNKGFTTADYVNTLALVGRRDFLFNPCRDRSLGFLAEYPDIVERIDVGEPTADLFEAAFAENEVLNFFTTDTYADESARNIVSLNTKNKALSAIVKNAIDCGVDPTVVLASAYREDDGVYRRANLETQWFSIFSDRICDFNTSRAIMGSLIPGLCSPYLNANEDTRETTDPNANGDKPYMFDQNMNTWVPSTKTKNHTYYTKMKLRVGTFRFDPESMSNTEVAINSGKTTDSPMLQLLDASVGTGSTIDASAAIRKSMMQSSGLPHGFLPVIFGVAEDAIFTRVPRYDDEVDVTEDVDTAPSQETVDPDTELEAIETPQRDSEPQQSEAGGIAIEDVGSADSKELLLERLKYRFNGLSDHEALEQMIFILGRIEDCDAKTKSRIARKVIAIENARRIMVDLANGIDHPTAFIQDSLESERAAATSALGRRLMDLYLSLYPTTRATLFSYTDLDTDEMVNGLRGLDEDLFYELTLNCDTSYDTFSDIIEKEFHLSLENLAMLEEEARWENAGPSSELEREIELEESTRQRAETNEANTQEYDPDIPF